MALITFTGVAKAYRRGNEVVEVLRAVDLTVGAGEVVALTGPSGSGKSTLLHLAGALDLPDSGQVTLVGQDLTRLDAGKRARLRRRHVGFVFQSFHLLPTLTVRENVELPSILAGRRATRRADELLERLDLSEHASQLPSELSGGQMQRTAIGRALLSRPDVVLADEPTGNLDDETGLSVLDLLVETAREVDAALVLATHDPSVARQASTHLVIERGHVVAQPTANR